MRIAFDIGGVISRYPKEMKIIMKALQAGGIDVCILTDMCREDATAALKENGFDFIPDERLFCATWARYGDLCKSVAVWYHEIDVLIDDRMDYCISESVSEGHITKTRSFIGFVLAPRPRQPYYAADWVNRESAMAFVPRSDYDAFRRWQEANLAKTLDEY